MSDQATMFTVLYVSAFVILPIYTMIGWLLYRETRRWYRHRGMADKFS